MGYVKADCFLLALFPFTYNQSFSRIKKTDNFKTVKASCYYSGFIFVVVLFSLFCDHSSGAVVIIGFSQ